MSEGSLLLGQMPGCLPELLALGIPGFPFLMGLPSGLEGALPTQKRTPLVNQQ